MDEQQQIQVDFKALQDAITVDPAALTGAVSLPQQGVAAAAPQETEQQQEPSQPAEAPDASSDEEAATHQFEKQSIATKLVRSIDRTFFGNEITPELMQDAETELNNLSDAELDEVMNYYEGNGGLSKATKSKIRNFLIAKDIEEDNTMLHTALAIPVWGADLMQSAAAGANKGATRTLRAAVDFIDWIDDATGDHINTKGFNHFMDDYENAVDALVPDGICNSIAASVGQNYVGFKVARGVGAALSHFGWVDNGVKAINASLGAKKSAALWEITKSAWSSTTAFGPKEGNLFDAVEQIPGLKNTFITALAIDPDDTKAMGYLKNFVASIVGDVAVGTAMRFLRKATGLVRRARSSDIDAVLDGDDPAFAQPGAKASADGTLLITQADYDDLMKDLDDVVGAAKKQAKAANKVRVKVTAPDVDVPVAVKRAQDLLNTADGSMQADFKSPKSVINTKPLGPEILQENGLESLLHLGDVTDDGVNALGRSVRNTEKLADADLILQVQKALNDMDETAFRNLEFLSQASEQFAHGILVSRQLLVDHTRALMGVLQKTNAPDITADIKQALIDNELTNVLMNTAKATAYFDTLSTNAGRALRAHQIKLSDIEAGISADKTYMNFLDKLGQMSAKEKITLARAMVMLPNARKSADFLKHLSNSNWKKGTSMLTEYWYNAMLSGPKTHARNFFGNAFKQAVLMPLDNLVGGLRGDRESWNRGIRGYWAMKESYAEALHMMKEAFNLGVDTLGIDNGMVPLQERAIQAARFGLSDGDVLGALVDGVGKAVNLPSRLLTTSDAFFKQMAYRTYIRTHLYTVAEKMFHDGLANGMSKQDFILDYIAKNFDQYFSDITTETGKVIKGASHVVNAEGVSDAVREVSRKALEYAKEATFQQDLRGISNWIREGTNKFPGLRFIMPFVTVPSNIMNEAINRTPLAFLNVDFYKQLRAGGELRDKAINQLITGSVLCGAAGFMAYEGLITGSAPNNRAVRDALYAQGWRPYSIKIGDTYVSYEGIEPLSNMFGIVADFAQIWKELDTPEMADEDLMVIQPMLGQTFASILGSVANNITNRSYYKGVADFLDKLMSGDPDKLLDYVEGSASSMLIPNLLRNVRQSTNPEMKEAKTFLERLKNSTSLWNPSLPTKYDWITGEPLHYMGERFSGISPIVWKTTAPDEALEALGQVQEYIPALPRTINGNTLTSQQASDFARLHGTVTIGGKTQLEALLQVVKDFKGADTYEMADAANKTVKKYRDLAKKELYKLHPDLKVNKKKQANKNVRDAVQRIEYKGGAAAVSNPVEAIARFR